MRGSIEQLHKIKEVSARKHTSNQQKHTCDLESDFFIFLAHWRNADEDDRYELAWTGDRVEKTAGRN